MGGQCAIQWLQWAIEGAVLQEGGARPSGAQGREGGGQGGSRAVMQ